VPAAGEQQALPGGHAKRVPRITRAPSAGRALTASVSGACVAGCDMGTPHSTDRAGGRAGAMSHCGRLLVRSKLAPCAAKRRHPNGRRPPGGGPVPVTLSLTVNGKTVAATVDPRTLLVEFLRNELALTGTHVGCDTGQCGACTVLVDGRAVKSCTILAAQADGAKITTIEGVAPGGELHPMQEAFRDCHALQCGFCTPGMVMAALDLVATQPNPDEKAVREGLDGNLCRCTGYQNIVKAVQQGALSMRKGG